MPEVDWNPERCCMFHGGRQCVNPAVADTVIGCEGEHVRERRHCAACVESLRTGQVFCMPCEESGVSHAVQLLRVTWDADEWAEEIGPDEQFRTSVRTEVVPGD